MMACTTRRAFLPLAVLALAGIVSAENVSYSLRPAPGKTLSLQVEKTGLLSGKKHQFVFTRFDGVVDYRPDRPEDSHVHLDIDATSIVCQDTWVSEKDRRKILDFALRDMLAADRYPQIAFTARRINRMADNAFEVIGDLTIRGVAKPASVVVRAGPQGQGALSFSGSAVIKLKDYGLKPPSAALGTIGTKNEMLMQFEITATRR